MSLIRALRPQRFHSPLATSPHRQSQHDALGRDLKQAQKTNMRTLGRQTLKVGDESKNSNSAADSLRLLSTPKSKPKPPQSEPEIDPYADLLNKEFKFLEAFETLDPESANQVARRWGASSRQLLRHGSAPEELPILAAHSYNHAKTVLSRKMPGASLAQLKAASEYDPEISQALSLMDTSSSYLRAAKSQAGQVSDNIQKLEAESRERQKRLAEMAAQNQKTFLMISETFSTIAAERRKTAAQLHSLEATTSQQISDMMMKSYLNRVKAAGKGHQTMVYLLSENWPQA